ncbi:hypothetical protein LOC67_22515 [Stieleria sp. JC731]|uniref:hypothetical protein n=1 Tax=Pirellulaceae TaxID=2691357 RepID=UPI001E5FB296|nr:hypothetical protein [Stieleria sp. JC731]MCC9603333.1 hypothetical protein [Stieleria sp. JC731]
MTLDSTDQQVEISCKSCGSQLLLASNQLSAVCPYCGSPSVISRPPRQDVPSPTFVIGFQVERERAAELTRQWIRRGKMFAPAAFKKAIPDLIQGIYMPAYLYGATALSDYVAEIGENYQETETYTTTDGNGKTVTRTRTVTKTEYRSLSGDHATYIMDVIVSASSGVSNDRFQSIEPYDLRSIRRFQPSMIAGWIAEEPSRTQSECYNLAREESYQLIQRQLTNFMPGDSHKGLRFESSFTREFIDLALLPVWCFAVRYDESKPPVQILVNGQTGRVAGNAPTSVAKVLSVIFTVIIILVVLVVLIGVSQG